MKLPLGSQSMRLMSVDRLPDEGQLPAADNTAASKAKGI
ncbi:hypothetical protein RINTU1_01670 [Candidatus Regiella insecticola]|uniref:Uncharacterized protein n=1 Tax=Candidatus Regiella insecticola TaxID=138073 RepID=A0A6L2ZLD3_9ENTR|nr:hypothetical protein RINTU1_01670 [Candidatus Regiella insecticola]